MQGNILPLKSLSAGQKFRTAKGFAFA